MGKSVDEEIRKLRAEERKSEIKRVARALEDLAPLLPKGDAKTYFEVWELVGQAEEKKDPNFLSHLKCTLKRLEKRMAI